MPRYRDMTTPELVAWARDWVSQGPAGRLIYALAARLEQEHQQARQQAPTRPQEPERERADTIARVIELGRLSREARDYLASKGRPTVPLADRPAAGLAMDEHSLRAQQQMANMAGHHGGVPPHWSDCQLGHWPTATRGY